MTMSRSLRAGKSQTSTVQTELRMRYRWKRAGRHRPVVLVVPGRAQVNGAGVIVAEAGDRVVAPVVAAEAVVRSNRSIEYLRQRVARYAQPFLFRIRVLVRTRFQEFSLPRTRVPHISRSLRDVGSKRILTRLAG